MMRKLIILSMAALFLSGCATWSDSQATKDGKPVVIETTGVEQVKPEDVELFEGDVKDRKYTVLAELNAVVRKTTIFNADPTREMVAEKLKEEAATLGADAVIQVRYGSVGVSMLSWGALEGKGRAIKYVEE